MQWDSPCYSPSIMPGNVERWVNYQLQPGESESCDNYYGYYYSGMQGITSTDWYRFGNNENIPTTAPEQLSCGSRNPVWLEGRLIDVLGFVNMNMLFSSKLLY